MPPNKSNKVPKAPKPPSLEEIMQILDNNPEALEAAYDATQRASLKYESVSDYKDAITGIVEKVYPRFQSRQTYNIRTWTIGLSDIPDKHDVWFATVNTYTKNGTYAYHDLSEMRTSEIHAFQSLLEKVENAFYQPLELEGGGNPT